MNDSLNQTARQHINQFVALSDEEWHGVEYTLTKFEKSTAYPLMALLKWSVDWDEQLTTLYKNRQTGSAGKGQPATN